MARMILSCGLEALHNNCDNCAYKHLYYLRKKKISILLLSKQTKQVINFIVKLGIFLMMELCRGLEKGFPG
jgi:hypothetical protein